LSPCTLKQRNNPTVHKESNMICGVTPITLSADELASCLSILRTHNKVLAEHGVESDLSMEKFREEFVSGRLKVKLTADQSASIMLLTDEIKANLIAHHIRMAKQIALYYCRCFNVTGGNRSDIVTESVCGLMKALYAYTSDTVKFTTYSHWIVTNSLKDHFRKHHNGLSPVSKKGASLNNEIEIYRSSNENISFGRAVAELRLSDKQVCEAVDARCSVASVSQVCGNLSTTDHEEEITVGVPANTSSLDESELSEAYQLCDLTIIERAVMDAAINPWHGWMVDLGREFAESGVPRKRQHIRMVLQRVQRKVQRKYEEMYSKHGEAA